MSSYLLRFAFVLLLAVIAGGAAYFVVNRPSDDLPDGGQGGASLVPTVVDTSARSDAGTALSLEVRRAEGHLRMFSAALEQYYLTHRDLPPTLDVLAEIDPELGEPYVDRIPDDPWGTPYELSVFGSGEFRLLSCGPDRQKGTTDDVLWPKAEEE